MGLPPIPPCALISSIASVAPLRMNSPYPPRGPERIVWQPILMGFFSFRSGVAAPKVRGHPRPARARAPDWRKRRTRPSGTRRVRVEEGERFGDRALELRVGASCVVLRRVIDLHVRLGAVVLHAP